MLTPARIMPKILVVDDEPDALEVLEFNLKNAGYEVSTADDGEAALKKARQLLPDLILLDLMLPEVDGLEVCKLLRRDPATSKGCGDRPRGGPRTRRRRLRHQALQPA
jgi:CheY-like chemotaxis protein